MKKQFLLITLLIIATTGLKAQKESISIENLCKKWKLQKYELFWIDYDPDEKEKKDYIYLKPDNTYESIDEGNSEIGTWSLTKKGKHQNLILHGKEDSLEFIIDDLRSDRLVLLIDHKELIDLKIHLVTN